jgi:HNH endonuclease
MHYKRWKRTGSLVRESPTAEQRFLQFVRKTIRCWQWTGQTNRNGYGVFWGGDYYGGKRANGSVKVLAHRWAYEHFVGPIPDGMEVLHSCDNPACVNWKRHLFLGSQSDNVIDMLSKDRSKSHLTAEQVAEIRAASTGQYGEGVRFAKQYGVSKYVISYILTGKRR